MDRNSFIPKIILTAAIVVVFNSSIFFTAQASATVSKVPYMASYSEDATSTILGQKNTFHATVVSPAGPTHVLVDFDLFDRNGNKIANTFVDNVTITNSAKSAANTFSFTSPANLIPGTYTWKVGIFQPGWGPLYNWYENTTSFTVIGSETEPNTSTVMYAGMWSPSPAYTANIRYLFTQFYNGDNYTHATVHFYIYNSKNNVVVADKAINDIWFEPITPVNEFMSVAPLPPGNYHLSIGIYSQDASQIYIWYDNVYSFTVNS